MPPAVEILHWEMLTSAPRIRPRHTPRTYFAVGFLAGFWAAFALTTLVSLLP